MFELVQRGGIVMLPLVLCSLVALTLIIERIWFYYSIKEKPKPYLKVASQAVHDHSITEAYTSIRHDRGPLAALTREFLKRYDAGVRDRREMDAALESVGKQIMNQLDANVGIIEVIATISPSLGLLGTVLGMMRAFNVLAFTTAAANPQLVSAGIAEALITTAAGLIIYVPCTVAVAYFNRRRQCIVEEMEHLGETLVQMLP